MRIGFKCVKLHIIYKHGGWLLLQFLAYSGVFFLHILWSLGCHPQCFNGVPHDQWDGASGLQPEARLKTALPANAASASSGFGRASASMSMFPVSVITDIVVTSASDSVSEPSTVGMPMGGSSKPSAFVAESASSMIPPNESTRAECERAAATAMIAGSESSRARYERGTSRFRGRTWMQRKKINKKITVSYDNAQNNELWRISGDRRTTRPRSVCFLLSQPSDVDGDCRANAERPEETLGGNSVFRLVPSTSRHSEKANQSAVKTTVMVCVWERE